MRGLDVPAGLVGSRLEFCPLADETPANSKECTTNRTLLKGARSNFNTTPISIILRLAEGSPTTGGCQGILSVSRPQANGAYLYTP
jgi:hypothetical protein